MKFYRIVLAAMFSAYTAAWSYISLLRFYSLNAFVLDLGVSMQFAWYAAENLGAFLYVLAYKGIVYFLLPLFLTKNYPAVLVFQSAFIGLAVFPLFGIARHYLHDDVSALLISASYLVYFPLAGVNWFDFHYQALFPTLFLLGYYFYVKGRYGISLAFMMISALTHYPYTVFPLMFALMSLFYKNRKTWYSLSLMAFTGFIFALNFALLGFYGATVGAYGIAGAGTAAPFATDALTMILLLLPLLFLPLLSKWSIFLLPFIALIAITNYSIYRYPLLFMYQYPALFAAFVFLGAIDAIRLFRGRERAISALLIISVSAFAIAYEPYSPLNQATSLNYSILGYSMQSMSINWQRYNGLIKVLSLIPPGASVLAQNNMPEIYPSNDTVYDSSFDNAVNRSVRYVVADPLSFSYNQGPGMGSQFAELWGSGNYGLLAEADGIILLERNYSGSIEYYQPLSMNYTAKQLSITGYAKLVNGTIEASNVSNEKLWYGPWTSVVPGLYMITFYLRGYNMNGGRVELLATANDWGTVLGSDVLNGSGIGPEWAPFQFYFYANSVYQQVELIGYAKGLSGELFMKNVSITQVGPGLPNSHDYYVFPDQLSTRGALRNYEITVSNASNEIAWYGPYLTLQPGHYIVRYELSTTNTSPYNRAMMQVTADSGKVVLGEQGITGSDTNMANVELYLNSTEQNVEFRGIVQNWPGNLTVKGIEVLSTSGAVNETYSAYGLYSEFYVNGTAQGSWYGPYTTLGPGNYSVTFVTNGKGTVNLQVTSDYGNKYIVTQTVSVPGTYTLNFSLKTEEQFVEFRGFAVNGNVQLVGVDLSSQR